MKKFIIVIWLTLLAAVPAIAQSQRFIELPSSDEGLIFLDTESINRNTFEIRSNEPDGILVSRYRIIDCQNRLVQILKVELYDKNQRLIASDNQPGSPMAYGANSSLAQSARVAGICKN